MSDVLERVRNAQRDIFDNSTRMISDEAVELTIQSIEAYGPFHDHWAVAWSGGKDSTATLTLLINLIEEGRIARPKTLWVFYADTRQELTPLQISAEQIMAQLAARPWIRVEVVMAEMDKRFLVYMLGRGVPPPNNNTFRWCTRQIKVDPMTEAVERRVAEIDGSVLMITGVRQGESAVRDRRIEMSCSKDGAECGQGWYQQVLPQAKGVRGRIATLAPILHWRVCLVWDWLKIIAPRSHGQWATAMLADAYGGEEAEEINARTGCMGCPLASRDAALEAVVAMPAWAYLAPLLGLKAIYRALRLPQNRLKKTGLDETGAVATGKNKQRMGPLTFEARLWALDQILDIQTRCNLDAVRFDRPAVNILNGAEEARIRELIAAGTWPNGWDGDEPTADTPLAAVFRDGSVQPLLIGGQA